MQIRKISVNILKTLGKSAALAALGCLSVVCVQAQQIDQPQFVALNTNAPLDLISHDLAHAVGANYSSSESSSIDAVDANAAGRLDLPEDAAQPPPRRRYGRPRYNDSSHNPDGSSKYAFIAGAGLTIATGNTYHYLNTSYSYQVGAGRNFSKNFSLLAQFDWDNFGFNGQTLVGEQNLNNYYINSFYQQNCTGSNPPAICSQLSLLGAVDGNSHVWSFSINPVYNIYAREGLGAYIVGGVGFYHKVANFTTPETGEAYEPGYGYYQYTANAVFDHYTSNAPGFNGGFGLTFKPSRFSGQRLYVEARYVFVDNSQRFGVRYGQSAATLNAYQGTNLYPQNSNRTTYIPIKAGIRF